MTATNKINALLRLFTSSSSRVVSTSKARDIAAVMNSAAGESTRDDFFDFYAFFLTIEGVGTLRLVVPKDAKRAEKQGCLLEFSELSTGELDFYLEGLKATPATPETTPERAALLADLRAKIAVIEGKTAAPAAPTAAKPRRSGRRMTSRDRLNVHIEARLASGRAINLRRGRSYRSC